MRYLQVAEEIRRRVAAGEFGAAGAVESEAALARRHGVSRVTVRRALELLRDEGVLTSRQGAGWFAAADPVRQTLGRFTTVEAAIEASGAPATREVLSFAFGPAEPDVAKSLGVRRGTEVLCVRRLNRAGDEPFALVTVWVPAALGAHLSRRDVEQTTFYDLLPLQGVTLARTEQVITARAATAVEARHLRVRTGSPLLAVRRITRDAAGTAVLLSEHRYPGHRTSIEVEFGHLAPASSRSAYPSSRHLRSVGARHG